MVVPRTPLLSSSRNVSPVAGAAVYDEGLGAHGMDTHTEARELAVPGIQGLSGSRASTVHLVSVGLTLAVLLAEMIFHFHASTGSKQSAQMSTPKKKPERRGVRKRHRLAV